MPVDETDGPSISEAVAREIFKAEGYPRIRDLTFDVDLEDQVVHWACEVWAEGAWYAAQFCELDPQVEVDWSAEAS